MHPDIASICHMPYFIWHMSYFIWHMAYGICPLPHFNVRPDLAKI